MFGQISTDFFPLKTIYIKVQICSLGLVMFKVPWTWLQTQKCKMQAQKMLLQVLMDFGIPRMNGTIMAINKTLMAAYLLVFEGCCSICPEWGWKLQRNIKFVNVFEIHLINLSKLRLYLVGCNQNCNVIIIILNFQLYRLVTFFIFWRYVTDDYKCNAHYICL